MERKAPCNVFTLASQRMFTIKINRKNCNLLYKSRFKRVYEKLLSLSKLKRMPAPWYTILKDHIWSHVTQCSTAQHNTSVFYNCLSQQPEDRWTFDIHTRTLWTVWLCCCMSWPLQIGVATGKKYSNLSITFSLWVMAAQDDWQGNKNREKAEKRESWTHWQTVFTHLTGLLICFYPPICVFVSLCLMNKDFLEYEHEMERRSFPAVTLLKLSHGRTREEVYIKTNQIQF